MCPAISPGTPPKRSNAIPAGPDGREWPRSFLRAGQMGAPHHDAAPQKSNEDTDWKMVPVLSMRSACVARADWQLRLGHSENVGDHDRAFPSPFERKRSKREPASESCSTAIRRTGAAR